MELEISSFVQRLFSALDIETWQTRAVNGAVSDQVHSAASSLCPTSHTQFQVSLETPALISESFKYSKVPQNKIGEAVFIGKAAVEH